MRANDRTEEDSADHESSELQERTSCPTTDVYIRLSEVTLHCSYAAPPFISTIDSLADCSYTQKSRGITIAGEEFM